MSAAEEVMHRPGPGDLDRAPLRFADDYEPIAQLERERDARDEARHAASIHWRALVGRLRAGERREAGLTYAGDVRELGPNALAAGTRAATRAGRGR